MKRILVVGLVLILLLSGLAACSKGEPADPGQGGETNAAAGNTEAKKTTSKGGKEENKDLTPYEAFDTFRKSREDVSGQISGVFKAVYNEFYDTQLYLERFASGDKEMYMHAVEVLLGHTDLEMIITVRRSHCSAAPRANDSGKCEPLFRRLRAG
ncbi:MAG: hypothetical protein GX819_02165 [Clostridiaceae bacterium]|nr:hypothetical protein [Clostridiaceae bacterium]